MINWMKKPKRRAATVDSRPRAKQLGVTNLIGDFAYDAQGNYRGKVEEVILDTVTGCARYVVLAHGGFLGIGRKRYAVSWRALNPDLGYRRCTVNMALINLTAIPVAEDDPWLQRHDSLQSRKNSFRFRRYGVTACARHDKNNGTGS